MRDPKEQALLERLQSGEEQALSELADAYGTKIFQLAFRYLRNKEDAEEITQDVLYKVYRNIGSFRGDAALSSWIYRITFNAAMSRVRPVSTATTVMLRWSSRIHATGRLSRRPPSTRSSPLALRTGGNRPGMEKLARMACQPGPVR